jgi:uncharacterized protein YdgA (DUF945 family)
MEGDMNISKSLLMAIFSEQMKQEMADMPPPEAGKKKGAEPAQPQAPSPEQIGQMAEAQIQALIQQKLLTAEGADAYKMVVSLKDGKLLLNGQPQELPF